MEMASQRHAEEIHQHSEKVRDDRNVRKRGAQTETCSYPRTSRKIRTELKYYSSKGKFLLKKKDLRLPVYIYINYKTELIKSN